MRPRVRHTYRFVAFGLHSLFSFSLPFFFFLLAFCLFLCVFIMPFSLCCFLSFFSFSCLSFFFFTFFRHAALPSRHLILALSPSPISSLFRAVLFSGSSNSPLPLPSSPPPAWRCQVCSLSPSTPSLPLVLPPNPSHLLPVGKVMQCSQAGRVAHLPISKQSRIPIKATY